MSPDLGEFDLVSGGAITGAVLYCLAAIPGAKGAGRVIEPDAFDGTNLNRYAPLRSEMVGKPKAADSSLSDSARGPRSTLLIG